MKEHDLTINTSKDNTHTQNSKCTIGLHIDNTDKWFLLGDYEMVIKGGAHRIEQTFGMSLSLALDHPPQSPQRQYSKVK